MKCLKASEGVITIPTSSSPGISITTPTPSRKFSIYSSMKKSNECPACGKAMEEIIDLPRYPLTEHYEPFEEVFHDEGYVDQVFLFCDRCAHGKLETVVPPELLYGEGYRTLTASSLGAMRAVENFAEFVKTYDLSQIRLVMDIGGNDATLAKKFEKRDLVLVDPNATGSDVERYRVFIENADLALWKGEPKLILSSHTLEHIENPHIFFSKVSEIINHGDLLALQVPSLELLCEDARLDQINHQHIHYFSLRSLSKILEKYGLEVIGHKYDSDHYGAVMVMCRRGAGEVIGRPIHRFEIEWAKKTFDASARGCNLAIVWRKPIALGASLALPILSYYLPNLANAEFIADDDESKKGLRYINFNKEIRNDYDLSGKDVVITAVGTKLACRKMIEKAFALKARNVISPLNTL